MPKQKQSEKKKGNDKKKKHYNNLPLSKKQLKRQQYYVSMKEKKKPVQVAICKFFIYGACKLDDCIYSHDVTPDQMKKFNEMCKYYAKGECAKGDMCCYMHGKFPCQFFHSKWGNVCKKGDECLFSHAPLTKETEEILENHFKSQETRDQIIEAPAAEITESVNIQNFGKSLFANSNLHNTFESTVEYIEENENNPEKEIYQNDNQEINLNISKENLYQNIEIPKTTTFSNLFSQNNLSVNNDSDDNNSLNNDPNIEINLPKNNERENILENLASNVNNIPKFTKISDDSDSEEGDLNICENVDLNNWNSYFKSNEIIDKSVDKIINKDSIIREKFIENSSPNSEIEKNNYNNNDNQSDFSTMNNQPIIFNEQNSMFDHHDNNTSNIIDLKNSRASKRFVENVDRLTENVSFTDNNQKLPGKRLLKTTDEKKGKNKKRKKDEINQIKTLESDDKKKKSKKKERISKKASKNEQSLKLTPSIINSHSNSDINRNNLDFCEPSSTTNNSDNIQINYNAHISNIKIDSSQELSNETSQEQIEVSNSKSGKDFEIISKNEDKNCPITNISEIDEAENIEWAPMCINADFKIIPVFIDSDDDDVDEISKVVEFRNENLFQVEKNCQENDSKIDFIEIENFSQNIPAQINKEENQNSLDIPSKWSVPILNLSPHINYHEMNINCYNLYHKFDDPRIRNHPRALKQSVYEWFVS